MHIRGGHKQPGVQHQTMKKQTIYGLALAGALVAAVPFLAYAQENEDSQQVPPPPQQVPGGMMGQIPQQQDGQGGDHPEGFRGMRPQNAENNRDFRNAAMRRSQSNDSEVGSSTHPMMFRADRENDNNQIGADEQNGNEDHRMLPPWITGSSTPFSGMHLSSTTMMQLMRAAREGTSTELRGHENRSHDSLVNFAQLQSNLISQLTQSLGRLKDARSKIADRIQTASQSGRDMTEATSLLATADQKISDAEQAVQAISSLAPAVSAQGSVNASTTVSLERPREIGKTAIQAVNEARKALNEVVIAIAHAMGFETDSDGHVLPPPQAATTTPATSTQQ